MAPCQARNAPAKIATIRPAVRGHGTGPTIPGLKRSVSAPHSICSTRESGTPGAYALAGERVLRCPWHGWEFDIRTGQSYCDPKRFRARAYPVNVEPGAAVVKGPYIAETLAVSVESDYVVVDL